MREKLTKREAIERSIPLWIFLSETGKMKDEWDGWGKYGYVLNDCFLCSFGWNTDPCSKCGACPYANKFGVCYKGNRPYHKWNLTESITTRKKYASLFLEQLKQLLEE